MGGSGLGALTSAKNFNELKSIMQSKYGITLMESVRQYDFQTVKSGLSGIATVIDEFPQMANMIESVTSDSSTNSYAYACYSYGKDGIRVPKIAISNHFKDGKALQESLKRDGDFHPSNTDARSVLAHEAGHALETAITRKNYQDAYSQFENRRKRKEATRIVGQAARQVKKTPYGKGKKNNELVAEVSRYATKNRSEALAECVGDYIANGSKAHPLSKAVWSILKKEMG